MNSSPHPRFACRVVRTWSSLSARDDSAAPHGLGSRHVENCPDCQEYFGGADELDAALRAEARTCRVHAPGLEQNVLRAVRLARAETPAAAQNTWAWRPVLAGAAAALLIAFVAHRTLPSRNDRAGVDVSPSELQTVLASAHDATAELWFKVQPRAVALAEADPLGQELSAVYTDARRAVDFLAANFLPSGISALGVPGAEERMLNDASGGV